MSDIKPLKSLGQHFLKKTEIATEIALALSGDRRSGKVLEIGPGTGVLTKALSEISIGELHCIEVDARSVEYLNQHFPELKGQIHFEDFLRSNLSFMGEGPFTVIGNFPYNISSQILFKVLDIHTRIPELVGMFQKEVAVRVTSPPGNRDYGILSVLLQAHYEMEYLFTVPPEAFDPPPKVQSGVIRMKLKSAHELSCDPARFKTLVKTAFNQRRKTLRNSIKSLTNASSGQVPYLDLRPEQLHYTQFVEMVGAIWPS